MSSPGTTRFVPQGFFLLRSTVLPVSAFEEFFREIPDGAHAPDPAIFRELGDAIFFASADLHNTCARTMAEGCPDPRLTETLEHYFLRASSRPAPFGLFAGVTLGTLSQRTSLLLAPRCDHRRTTRIDYSYWFALASLAEEPRAGARYYSSRLMHRLGDAREFTEARITPKGCEYTASSVDDNNLLSMICAAADRGCTADDITAILQLYSAGLSQHTADQYISQLLEAGILFCPLLPPLLQGEGTQNDDFLASFPAEVAEAVEPARRRLVDLDRSATPDLGEYSHIDRNLRKSLANSREITSVFHTVLVKPPVDLSLGHGVIKELEEGINLLRRVGHAREDRLLDGFARAFSERYGDRAVPLVEALDDDVGVGFSEETLASYVVPQSRREGNRLAGLLDLIERACRRQQLSVELLDSDVLALGDNSDRQLPGTFTVVATLSARDAISINRGAFSLYLHNILAPPACRLMARFSGALPELVPWLAQDISYDEASDPQSLFAEIDYLPVKASEGNVLSRPRLRRWTLTISGAPSGAGAEEVLPADIFVLVEQGEIILRSQSLNRRVYPRVTSAHNFLRADNLPLYRFLGSIQWQSPSNISWVWDQLEEAPFLPRIQNGRVVLSLARWCFRGETFENIRDALAAGNLRAAARILREAGLPRWLTIEGLLVDLELERSLARLQRVVRRQTELSVTEFFPPLDSVPLQSDQGYFISELDIPFRSLDIIPEPQRRMRNSLKTERFPPGTEYLFVKLYAKPRLMESLLALVISPAVEFARQFASMTHWFFVRYADPRPHLRVRFYGDPRALLTGVLSHLSGLLAPYLADGRCTGFLIDTYEPEIDRYGGERGLQLSEQLFSIDSDAVLALLTCEGSAAQRDSDRLALGIFGVDQLLRCFHLDDEQKSRVLNQLSEGLRSELQSLGKFDRKELASTFRRERGLYAAVLAGDMSAEQLAAFERRHRRLEAIAADLYEHERDNKLALTVAELVPSYCHMFINRLFQRATLAGEYSVYDYLARLYVSSSQRSNASR